MRCSPLVGAAAVLFLTGCAGPIETRVTSIGEPSIAAARYLVTGDEPVLQGELLLARNLVTDALLKREIAASPLGELNLEVTISSRLASLGLKQAESTVSQAKSIKLLQNCIDREYRLGITLTRIADGKQLYRGTAAQYHCHATLADTVPKLVDAAIADLGAPKGSYTIKNKGQE
jgi:hypothetical protein